jgi:hypothetical protein
MALGSLGIIHVATIANALAHVFLQAGESADFFQMAQAPDWPPDRMGSDHPIGWKGPLCGYAGPVG